MYRMAWDQAWVRRVVALWALDPAWLPPTPPICVDPVPHDVSTFDSTKAGKLHSSMYFAAVHRVASCTTFLPLTKLYKVAWHLD